MNRFVRTLSAAVLVSMIAVPAVRAQAQPARPTTPAPAAPAKFVPPVRGAATIDVVNAGTKRMGGDLVTTVKVKNTSSGAIHLLKVEEYWYDAKGAVVSSSVERWRKPLMPGEIVELQLKAPANPGAGRSNLSFSHANGTIKPKSVKAFQ
jgi:uncharacterized protein YcfL